MSRPLRSRRGAPGWQGGAEAFKVRTGVPGLQPAWAWPSAPSRLAPGARRLAAERRLEAGGVHPGVGASGRGALLAPRLGTPATPRPRPERARRYQQAALPGRFAGRDRWAPAPPGSACGPGGHDLPSGRGRFIAWLLLPPRRGGRLLSRISVSFPEDE